MYQYKNIMVALDLSYMDEQVIKYTSFISNLIQPENIYFINIQKDLEVPDEIKVEFENLGKPRDESVKRKMIESVKSNFDNHEGFKIDYKVAEGEEIHEMLHWTKVKNIDLLVVGRKDVSNGSGHIAQVLTRKVMNSVLMVPEKLNTNLKEILVPIDFSEYSDMAFDKAVEIARNQEGVKIYLLYIYHLPAGYYTTGKSEEEFSEIMKKNAMKQFSKYVAEKDVDDIVYEITYQHDDSHHEHLLINKQAKKTTADLIIIGAKGRTPATSIFLGSIAEKLTKTESNVPLLIVKSKEKSFDILELIKSI
ncbi:MAG: universal stress protein [Chitinophagales bacterium]|nr:universal stress protein [Chitinophagales bacterium]